MSRGLDLDTAEFVRERLTIQQQRDIRNLYKRAAQSVAKEAEKAPRVPSDHLRRGYLRSLEKQLLSQVSGIGKDIESTILNNMFSVSSAVISDNMEFLRSVGMPIQGAFSHVADDVVTSVLSGRLYKGNWSLSKAIWNGTRKIQKDIQKVVAEGIALNKSAYDIAKDLEKYVDPSVRKDWNWSKVYPGTNRVVDYNAQRLARTMVSHAYQQSFVRTTQRNPFVTKYQWISSGARTCPICADRDGNYYEKNDLPLDHPNGMCTFVAVIEDSMLDIADRIADWVSGEPDPELDDYAKFLSGS